MENQPTNNQNSSNETQDNPNNGQPYSGQPYNGQPYSGQPYNGQPYNGQPYNGQPYNGQPYNGQPYNGQPYNGQPYNGQDPYGQAPKGNDMNNGVPIPPPYQNANTYNNAPVNPNAYMQSQFYPPNEPPQSGYAVASLILGIMGLLFGCCYGIGSLLGVASIVLAIISRNYTNDRMTSVATAGMVCGILSLASGVFFFGILLLSANMF